MRGKGICAIALGVLMGLACFARGEQGVTGTTIEIGAFGPITGPAAYIGLGGRDGANLAVKEINAAGSVIGRKLGLHFEVGCHSATNAGDALTKQLQSWFDITPIVRVEFNIGDKDFTSQLLQVQQAQPQAIAFFGNPAEAAIAMRKARELGLNQPFFVGVTMVDQNFIAAAR